MAMWPVCCHENSESEANTSKWYRNIKVMWSIPGENRPSRKANSNWIRLGLAECSWVLFYSSPSTVQAQCNKQLTMVAVATTQSEFTSITFFKILTVAKKKKKQKNSNSKCGWSHNSNNNLLSETGGSKTKQNKLTSWPWHMKWHCLTMYRLQLFLQLQKSSGSLKLPLLTLRACLGCLFERTARTNWGCTRANVLVCRWGGDRELRGYIYVLVQSGLRHSRALTRPCRQAAL